MPGRIKPTFEFLPFKKITGIRKDLEPIRFALMTPLPSTTIVHELDQFHTDALGFTPLPLLIHVERHGRGYQVIGGFRDWQWASVLAKKRRYPPEVPVMVWPRLDTEICRVFALADCLVKITQASAQGSSKQALAGAIMNAIRATPGVPTTTRWVAKALGTTLRTVQRSLANAARSRAVQLSHAGQPVSGPTPARKGAPASAPAPAKAPAPAPAPADATTSRASVSVGQTEPDVPDLPVCEAPAPAGLPPASSPASTGPDGAPATPLNCPKAARRGPGPRPAGQDTLPLFGDES